MRFHCGFSDFKTKLDANSLFGTFTHCKNRYDINALVTSATYYSQLSKRSHLQLVSWTAKTCTNMSRLVVNTSHPVNNHYISNLDTIWTNLVYTFHRSLRLSPDSRMWNMSKAYKTFNSQSERSVHIKNFGGYFKLWLFIPKACNTLW